MYTHTTQKQHLTKKHSRHSSRIARKVDRAAQTKEARERNLAAVQLKQALPDKDLPLQKTIGTQEVHRLLQSGGIQAKLKIGHPGDKYEQEADRVGDEMMRMPEPQIQRQPDEEEEELIQIKPVSEHITPLVQRQVEEEEEDETVQAKLTDEGCLHCQNADTEEEEYVQSKQLSGVAHPVLFADIGSPGDGGQPLPEPVRSFFEPRFGHDFSKVRTHTDTRSEKMAEALNARSYTTGNDIVFGAGQFNPHSQEGSRLIAHELTHVVQQNKKSVTPGHQQRHRPETAISKSTRPGIIQRKGRRGLWRRRGGKIITIDSRRARIDQSMGVDAITRQFYRIPIELLPPRTSTPMEPLLTTGRGGCSLRRYGLTVDDFSISYRLDDADVMSVIRPSIGGNLVECWAWRVRFRLRQRQRILLPNDLATHPCLESVNPRSERAEILAHERLHEEDNNAAVRQVSRNLGLRLTFMVGIGYDGAMARITDDPEAFVEECREDLHHRLEAFRDEHEMMYARISTEMAIQRDPHDEEFHQTKLRLLEEARARHALSH